MSFLSWRRGRGASLVPELGVKLRGLFLVFHTVLTTLSFPLHWLLCSSIGMGHVASGLPIPALPHSHFVTLDPCPLFLSLSFVFYKMNMIPVW